MVSFECCLRANHFHGSHSICCVVQTIHCVLCCATVAGLCCTQNQNSESGQGEEEKEEEEVITSFRPYRADSDVPETSSISKCQY